MAMLHPNAIAMSEVDVILSLRVWASSDKHRAIARRLHRPGYTLDPGLMTGCSQKPQEVIATDRCGHGVDQGMKVERCMFEHRCIEHDCYGPIGIVESAEGRDRAGLNAQGRPHDLRGSKRKPPVAETMMQRFQRDLGVFQGCYEKQGPLLVLQEQVFGVPAGYRPPVRARPLDRKQGWMRDSPVVDAKSIQKIE
jgi:hypothetical protein